MKRRVNSTASSLWIETGVWFDFVPFIEIASSEGEDLSSSDSDVEVLSDDDSEVDERVKLMNGKFFFLK